MVHWQVFVALFVSLTHARILRETQGEVDCIPSIEVLSPGFGELLRPQSNVTIEMRHGCEHIWTWDHLHLTATEINDQSSERWFVKGPLVSVSRTKVGFHAIELSLSLGDGMTTATAAFTMYRDDVTKIRKGIAEQLPSRNASVPAVSIGRPVKILLLDDGAAAYDGIKQTFAWQAATMVTAGDVVDFADLSSSLGHSPFYREMADKWRSRIFTRTMRCPASMCVDGTAEGMRRFVNDELPFVRHVDELPSDFRNAAAAVIDVVDGYDVVVLAFLRDIDLYLFHLIRLQYPHIRRVLHLGPGRTRTITRHTPCDALFAPSFEVANRREIQNSGIPMQAILHGFDVKETWNPAKVSLDSTLHSHGTLAVLAMSRLSPEKGIGELLHAWKRVQYGWETQSRDGNREAVLWIAGGSRDPKYRAALERLAQSLGIRDKVRFLGFVEPSRIPGVYAAATIVVCAYNSRETFGLTAVEAMAMARPVVHFGVGGMGDYTVNGTTALVPSSFHPNALADSLLFLLRNDDYRSRLGQTARRFTEDHLSQHVWGPRLRHFYHSEARRSQRLVME